MADTCPDCLRHISMRPGDSGCRKLQRKPYEPPSKCDELTIARLRARVAELKQAHQSDLTRIAELEDALLDAARARNAGPPTSIEEIFSKLDADGVQLKVDPDKLDRLQAKVAAEISAERAKVAEREHLEEEARLLVSSQVYEYPSGLDEWLEAERARQAKGDKREGSG